MHILDSRGEIEATVQVHADFRLISECSFLWSNERVAGKVMKVAVNPSAADELWYSAKHLFHLQ